MSVSASSVTPGVANSSAPCGIAARSIQPQSACPLMAAPSIGRPAIMMNPSRNANVARSHDLNAMPQPGTLASP